MADDRELLDQAEDALHSLALRLLAVKPWLDKPYKDMPELAPWTNTIGAQARRAHDLALEIRKHLGLPYRHATRALGTPPLAETDIVAEGAAAERERLRTLLAGDQVADHAPIESIYGTVCRTCVAWQDAPVADGGETEFGIAIPEQWPCAVARALEVSP